MTVNRTQIFATFPWLLDHSLPLVTSPDLDGLLCVIALAHLARKANIQRKVLGFYDIANPCKLWLTPTATRADAWKALWVDQDIVRRGILSIGQHLLIPRQTHVKPNELPITMRSICNPNFARIIDGGYLNCGLSRKYPFGTIHWLITLFGLTFRAQGNDALALADSAEDNMHRYERNAYTWLQWLDNSDLRCLLQRANNQLEAAKLRQPLVQYLYWYYGFENGNKNAGQHFQPPTTAEEANKLNALAMELAAMLGWEIPSLFSPTVLKMTFPRIDVHGDQIFADQNSFTSMNTRRYFSYAIHACDRQGKRELISMTMIPKTQTSHA